MSTSAHLRVRKAFRGFVELYYVCDVNLFVRSAIVDNVINGIDSALSSEAVCRHSLCEQCKETHAVFCVVKLIGERGIKLC